MNESEDSMDNLGASVTDVEQPLSDDSPVRGSTEEALDEAARYIAQLLTLMLARLPKSDPAYSPIPKDWTW